MNTTIVLAQALGIIFTGTGLSLLMRKKSAMEFIEAMTQNQPLMWLSGFMALIFGAVIVSLNNVWNAGLVSLFITLCGWLAILKGLFILITPNVSGSFYRKVNKGGVFVSIGIIVLVIGLILLYKGFM